MNKIRRDSLQWKIAVNTFSSIMLSTILVVVLLTYLLSPYLALPQANSIIYLGILIAAGLIILAIVFASRTYMVLSGLIYSLEHLTLALPLLSSKKYDEAKEAFKLGDKKSEYDEITQLQFAVFQLTSS